MTQPRKTDRTLLVMMAGALMLAHYGVTEARGTRSHQTQVQRTTAGHTRSDTWTSSQGKSASRNAVVVNDRNAGTRTRDVQWQGPQGQQATRHDVTQRTDHGYTRDSTATNAQGQTATRSATVANDPAAGTRSRDVTATGFNGGARTVNDDLQRTSDGYMRQTTATQADGDVTTRNVTASYDLESQAWTRDVSVTHDDGG